MSKFTRPLISVIIIALLSPVMPGRGQIAVVATKDPQGVATLAQCLGAVGGVSAISAVQDYTGTGNITYFWADEQVQGTVTLRGMGAGDFRLDAVLPAGNRSWAVSAGQGFIQGFDGKITPLAFNDANNLGGFSYPFLAIVNSLSDSTISVTNLGSAQLNGHPVSRIQLQKILPAAIDPGGKSSAAMTQVFAIDSSTFQLVDVQYMTIPNDHTSQTIPHDVEYSGYQPINGVLVPFTITEQIGGQQTMTVQLSSVTFNTGLTDAIFQP